METAVQQSQNHEIEAAAAAVITCGRKQGIDALPFSLPSVHQSFLGPPVGRAQMDTSWHRSIGTCNPQMSAPCSRTEQGKSRNKYEGKQATMDWHKVDIAIKSRPRKICTLYHHYLMVVGAGGCGTSRTGQATEIRLTTTGKKSVKLLYVESMTESSKEKTLKQLILIREFNKVA